MIGKEGPQTDDMNSVSQSVEIVKKWKKIKTIVNKYGWADNLHSRVSGNGSAQVQVQGQDIPKVSNSSFFAHL